MSDPRDPSEASLEFTVAAVWREFRVSCPHPDVLRAARLGGLPEDAAAFVRFHLEESRCPYCSAVAQELEVLDQEAERSTGADVNAAQERVLRSTMTFLRRVEG